MVGEIKNLDEWIEKLRSSNFRIFVEGFEDKKALEYFEIKKVTVIKGKPLFEIAESCSEREVVILTDLDKEGKSLYRKLKIELLANGIKINDKFRIFLFKETKLRQIQGLKRYYEKEIRKLHGF